MIKHVVMWRLKDGVSEGDRLEMKSRLEGLLGVVPVLLKIEVGMNTIESSASMDMVLCAEFKSKEDLAAYASHPKHLDVVEFVKPLVSERAVVDFNV